MAGIVLLVAIVTGTREPSVIAELTALPVDFVGTVMELCHRLDLWWSPRFYELQRTIREQSDNAEEVSDALHCVKEEFWTSWFSRTVEAVLHSSRQNLQYGGAKDTWVTLPDGEHLEKASKPLELVKR
jgi:hypothetical protein